MSSSSAPTVAAAFLVSVFFSNSKLAAIVGPVALFLTILPKYIFFSTNANEAVPAKYAASILPPTAFTFGADILAQYEYAKVGVQWGNMFEGNFSFASVLVMLFIDILFYGFWAWYLDQVVAHEVGTARHPLFLFLPSYWAPVVRSIKRACGWQELRNRPAPPDLPLEMRGGEAMDGGVVSHDGGVAVGAEATVESLSADLVARVQVIASGLRKVRMLQRAPR